MGEPYKGDFSTVESACLFAGCPRTGHSLITAILGAHPYMMFSDEVDIKRKVASGYTQEELFKGIVKSAERENPKFPFDLPWATSCETLKVIGVKPSPPLTWGYRESGSKNKWPLIRDLGEIRAILEVIRVPVKIIHPIRDPHDTIASMFHHGWARNNLIESAELYFDTFDLNMKMRAIGLPWFSLRLEDLIAIPKSKLIELCHFLGQKVDWQWLTTCAEAIWERPREMREKVKWSDEAIQFIDRETQKRELLWSYIDVD